jgi:hypothetical protein
MAEMPAAGGRPAVPPDPGSPAAPGPSPPGPAELRWALVLYGTAAFVPASLLLAVLTAGGREVGRLFVDNLAAPFPIPIAIGYGAGYLLVHYRVRDPRPSFLQSQVFAGCVFVGAFVAFVLCSVVISHSPLHDASRTAVLALLVPVKVVLGGLAGAYLYPPLARVRLADRCTGAAPILPPEVRERAAATTSPPPPSAPPGAGRRAAAPRRR